MAADKDTNQKPTKETKPDAKEAQKKERNPALWYFVAIVVLLVTAGIGAYWWRDAQAKEAKQQFEQRVGELEGQVTKLEEENQQLKAQQTEEEATGPTAADLENIQAAIESGNYAALEGFMASTVSVILAATECCGGGTPAEAVANMDYADNGTAPWNWSVPEATIDSYRAGFYVNYFPEGVLVGKAANDFVIAFSFNDAGEITQIFMAIKEDILL